MVSSNEKIKYVRMELPNFKLAYEIEKQIFPTDPDYQGFYHKAMDPQLYDTCYLVYLEDNLIGITGTYIEDFDPESIWLDWFGILPEYRRKGYGKTVLLDTIYYCQQFSNFEYLRLDTTYYENRPALFLYDKVMDLKEDYTIEDTETDKHQYLIYTYNLKRTGYTKPWNNRFIDLVEHYEHCSGSVKGDC